MVVVVVAAVFYLGVDGVGVVIISSLPPGSKRHLRATE
jgi:hypothetical protein